MDIICVTLDCADPARVAVFPRAVAARYRTVILRDPEGNEFCLSGGSLG